MKGLLEWGYSKKYETVSLTERKVEGLRTVLFSQIHRVDTGPSRHSESRFSYLDRSARPTMGRIRQVLERWWAEFPLAEQAELRKRIRSEDDRQHFAAVFELYIHQILLRTQHHVEIHRQGDRGKCPDFLATASDCTSFVLEATVATETDQAQQGAEKRKNQLYDTINKLESPDYFLDLEMEGEPKTPIPGERWLRELRKWVASLDYEDIVATGRQGAFDLLPMLSLEHDGLTVTFKPIAKKAEARGHTNVRPIGVQCFEAVCVRSWEAIQRAVQKKASRYGTQDIPYLIAINGVGVNCDYDEFERALYGPDGLWRNGRPPAHTRVSAILAVEQLVPATIGSVNPCLFHNPFAANPYSGPLCQLPQVRLMKQEVRQIPGISASDLLGLPSGWPLSESEERPLSP